MPMAAVAAAYDHGVAPSVETETPTNAPTATSCPMATATETHSETRGLENVHSAEQEHDRW